MASNDINALNKNSLTTNISNNSLTTSDLNTLQDQQSLTGSSQGRNVLIFVADGLRPSSVNPEDAPTLSSIRSEGVNFVNSHSLFPTFTTPNASAIATGHYLGDTGDFSNTIYAGFPVPSANGSPTPFIENNAVLGDLNAQFQGNYDASDPDTFSYYNFLNEESLLQFARNNGYNTAAVGKVGPVLIQDVSQGSRDPSTGTVPPPQTIIIDDSTGKTGGVPLSQDITQRLVTAGVGATAPDRSNGVPAGTPLNNGFSGNNTTSGTQAANYVQQQYFTDAVTKAILPQFGADYSSSDKPFAMVYWSRDPDGTQHNQGDSLNSLTPGINGATSKAAVKNADNNLAQIIDELKSQKLPDGSSLYDNTDIFITSDHGFSTISKSPTDTQGNVVKDYASSLTFPGVNPGFLPPGFVAIDIAHDLGLTLYDPDTPVTDSSGKAVAYKAVDPTLGQRTTSGNGLIGGSGQILAQPDAKVVVAANGGSDLIYVPDNDVETVKKVVDFLSKQDYTSGLFVNDDFGAIKGALPLSSINLKGSAQTPTPSIVLNFRTFATNPDNPTGSEVEIADTGLQQGQGMHGSFGRGDTYNNMLAIGPDFKSNYTDLAPVSNADVAVTLANILGFNIPSNGDLVGRVAKEALVGNPDNVDFTKGVLASDPTENGIKTYLNYQQVGDTKYFDAAGFSGRTVGLNTGEKHVLILSIDGLRAADLADPNLQKDIPNILSLENSGVTFTNAYTTVPSDSFPGTLAYFTGATPKTTGVYYDDSYDRNLKAPGSNTLGTEVLFDESIDKNPDLLSGGGDYGVGSIDVSKLPVDAQGNPVYPHNYVNVNTIFDVAKSAGLYTAYSEKHSGAYDILNASSGDAVDDYYSPEIAAKVAIEDGKLVDASTAKDPSKLNFKGVTSSVTTTKLYDDLKVNAVINEINGLNSLGTNSAAVPAIFGMNFQALSVAQKDVNGGIAADGTPSAELEDALKHTDQSVGKIIDALKQQGLLDSTLVVVTAKHGQNPRLGSATLIKDDTYTKALESVGIQVAQATQDDVALIWLDNQQQASDAAQVLNIVKRINPNSGIDEVYAGDDLQKAGFGNPSDGRTPDLIVKLKPGYVLVGNPANPTKQAEHGGFSEDDTHVALVVGGNVPSDVQGTKQTDRVNTTQIAVTALDSLGLNPNDLQGAVAENTQELPGLFA